MQILVLSDLHFGHKRIPGSHIYENLKQYVYPRLPQVQLVVCTGDTFHSLLDFNNDTSRYVILFLHELFYMSHRYHFGIRILRGTFTHDRNQVQYIQQNAYKYFGDTTIDLKTYSDISLDEECVDGEYLRCAYLPDDLPYNSQDEVLAAVRTMMDSRKWDSLDIIFGHGYMRHVLPADVHGPRVLYTLESLSTLCKHLVVFGHVHTPSVRHYENISGIYVGSFERMAHGEEEHKGYITIDTATWATTFHKNKNTLLFLTFTPSKHTTEDIVEEFKAWIHRSGLSTINTNFIRVIHSDPSVRTILGKILRTEFLQYKCVYSAEAGKRKTVDPLETKPITTDEVSLIPPTEDNIVDLITAAIKERHLCPVSRDRIEAIWKLQFDEGVYG